VTAISRDTWNLHMLTFWVCVVIGVFVFGAMFYSLIAFRRSKHPTPATFHESTVVEIAWTLIPFLILVGLAIPAAGTLIRQYDTRNSDLTVKITGYQWKWQYEYVDKGVSFFSTIDAKSNFARQLGSGIDPRTVPNYLHEVDNYLVLPVGKKVRFLLTANDVIHGWWVPDLAVKKDAIPGYINEMWTVIDEPGVYRGQCTVLCGRDHGFMPIVVKAVPPAEFEAWVKEQGGTEVAAAAPVVTTDAAPASSPAADAPAAAPAAPASAPPTQMAAADAAKPAAAPAPAAAAAPAKLSKADLVAAGEKVYAANCKVCHQDKGQGLPPTFPSLIGDKIVTGPAEGHINQILKGKNAMPPFARLSDADIAAVATFERNSWGNSAGEVQPAQVAAQRGK
jgi:cytochrome c oxidase subunit 2